jgi:hypothetical protein
MFWVEIAIATIIGFLVGVVTMGTFLKSVRNIEMEDRIVSMIRDAQERALRDREVPPGPPKS